MSRTFKQYRVMKKKYYTITKVTGPNENPITDEMGVSKIYPSQAAAEEACLPMNFKQGVVLFKVRRVKLELEVPVNNVT